MTPMRIREPSPTTRETRPARIDSSDPAPRLPVSWSAPWPRDAAMLSLLVLCGALATLVDAPLSRWLVDGKGLRAVHGMLAAFEPFGQPTAIFVTAAAIALCDARRRRAVPRLLVGALGAGLAADLVKLCVARTRPHHADLAQSALATFQGMFPGLGNGSPQQSFPSAHTATAVGFALGLWTLFPAGRGLFVSLAALVALQRVEGGAHFVSDTLWGAAVGYAVCLAVYRRDMLGGWFDGIEFRGCEPLHETARNRHP